MRAQLSPAFSSNVRGYHPSVSLVEGDHNISPFIIVMLIVGGRQGPESPGGLSDCLPLVETIEEGLDRLDAVEDGLKKAIVG